jgi:CRP-like cAMP-binding protein
MQITSQLQSADLSHGELESAGNRLLAALSAEALALIKPHLHKRDFHAGEVLSNSAGTERQIYFPQGLVSIATGTAEDSIEVASISREGAAGLHELVDQEPTTRMKVLVGGTFSCMSAHRFSELEKQHEDLAAMGTFCRDWMLLQAQHMAVCNAGHSAEARFARWLLLAMGRMECEVLPMTQEDIARLLGIRRTTVTLIAQKLQDTGMIRYSRGKIAIRDADALQATSCECCRALRPDTWPSHRMGRLGLNGRLSAASTTG